MFMPSRNLNEGVATSPLGLEGAPNTPSIEVHADIELGELAEVLSEGLAPFAEEMSEWVHAGMNETLDVCGYIGNTVSPEIRSFLEERGLTYPSFELLVGDSAEEFAEETGLEANFAVEALEEGAGLLVFQLPPPIAQYWWKYSRMLEVPKELRAPARVDADFRYDIEEDYRAMQERLRSLGISLAGTEEGLGSSAIEWGFVYTEVMHAFYEKFDDLVDEVPVVMERINHCGQHDPDAYYYCWLVYPPENAAQVAAAYDERDGAESDFVSEKTLKRLRLL